MTHAPANTSGFTLNADQLDAYLARIGEERPKSPDLTSLSRLHRAHLMTFTWEALDAFMGWPSAIAPSAAFEKMVVGRRGGWCHEMNGLFGAALAGLGFRVTRLCGGVNRATLGNVAIGNHLTLRVDLDSPYLAEVGLADAIIEPVPLAVGSSSQRGFAFSIVQTEDGWLRMNNHAHGIARSVDFRPDYSDEAAIASSHDWLMRDPGSPFTSSLAILRHVAEGYVVLQNDRLRHVTATSVREQRIAGADHLADALATIFDLDIPQPQDVWERIEAIRYERAA